MLQAVSARHARDRLAGTVDVLLLADLNESALDVGEPFTCDITDQAAVEALVARAASIGTLRTVVHSAGISPTMGDWRRILDVDLVATARLVEAIRPLATVDTAIVCVASMAAHLSARDPNPAADAAVDDPLADGLFDAYRAAVGEDAENPGTAYGWAKRGVQRLVVRGAVTLGPVGARICSISPGMIDTPMGRQEFEQQPMMKMLEDITPLRRQGRADELAAAVAFLVSDDASFITGVDLLVDGGAVAAVEGML